MEWIDFDIDKLKRLKGDFEQTMDAALEQLPKDVNWDSPQQIKDYFRKSFDLPLENAKIQHLESQMEGLEHTSELFDVLNGLVIYLKTRATVRNYIDCILRHQFDGRLDLRQVDGIWMMPNKQSIFASKELWGCVRRLSPTLASTLGSQETASW